MARLPLAALALALAACRDHDGTTPTTTGVTTFVTTLTTDATSTSTGVNTTGDGVSGTTSTATTDAASTTTSTSTTSTTTTTGGETTAADTSSSTTSVDPVAACLAMVDPGDECSACICTDCLTLWDDCHADEGCSAIQKCAQDSGCYTLDCLPPCMTTINFWGGVDGPSWNLWLPLSDCLKATCRPLCPW